MKAFKAYDIRGVFNQDWNAEDAYKIGFFLPSLLKAKDILVGRDIRISSDEIFSALSRGISDAGAHVTDLGLCTTPMVYWATAKLGFAGSVQITASHNPKQYNGLKVSGQGAIPIGYDTGLHKIKHWIETEPVKPASRSGSIRSLDILDDYQRFLSAYVPDFGDFKLAIDASNGMAGLLIDKLFGSGPDYINLVPDGNFPNHDPNPLELKNVAPLSQMVSDGNYDLGIIFDGDADRVMFVDEKGSFISPDLMIAVLGHHFLHSGQKTRVLQDIRTSRSVGEYLEGMGAEMHTWRVGRAYASPKLKEIDGLFGGELAGHYYFKEFYYSDSGILASLLITKVLAKQKRLGQPVSEFLHGIQKYVGTGEINYEIADKSAAIEAVSTFFTELESPIRRMDFDGIRLDYPDWWMNIRPSNTEPYLRFIAEASTEEQLKQIQGRVEEILQPYR